MMRWPGGMYRVAKAPSPCIGDARSTKGRAGSQGGTLASDSVGGMMGSYEPRSREGGHAP
jgi:hypothetical protein